MLYCSVKIKKVSLGELYAGKGENYVLTLKDGEITKRYQVVKLDLDLNIERRLEALGMTNDAEITVLNKKRHGAVILKVRGTRFAVGRQIAEGIQIKEAPLS